MWYFMEQMMCFSSPKRIDVLGLRDKYIDKSGALSFNPSTLERLELFLRTDSPLQAMEDNVEGTRKGPAFYQSLLVGHQHHSSCIR
jgi:hypothetical protein